MNLSNFPYVKTLRVWCQGYEQNHIPEPPESRRARSKACANFLSTLDSIWLTLHYATRTFCFILVLKLNLGSNNLLWGITRKIWLTLRMDWFSRLWVMAGRNMCRRFGLKTSSVKIGELFPVIFFILFRVIMIWSNNVFRWLYLRFLRLWEPDNENKQNKLWDIYFIKTMENKNLDSLLLCLCVQTEVNLRVVLQ